MLCLYCCNSLLCAGLEGNWSQGARIDAEHLATFKAMLPLGHEWVPSASSVTDGHIKINGTQAPAAVYNDAMVSLAAKSIKLLTVLGNKRGTLQIHS